MKWLILAVAIVFNALANVLIKAGMRQWTGQALTMAVLPKVVLSPFLIAGVASFGLALVTYSYSLTKLPLSLGYPIMSSVGLIIVAVSSVLFFEETYTLPKLLGTLLILVGVFLVAQSA